jgi:hypothetical protein
LSEFGGIQLEFRELSRILKNPIFTQKMKKIQDTMDAAAETIPSNIKGSGLLPVNFNANAGTFTTGKNIRLFCIII